MSPGLLRIGESYFDEASLPTSLKPASDIFPLTHTPTVRWKVYQLYPLSSRSFRRPCERFLRRDGSRSCVLSTGRPFVLSTGRPFPRGRSWASFTISRRPPNSRPSQVSMAWEAVSSVENSTNPKPRLWPVSRSVMILALFTTPDSEKASSNSASVTLYGIFPTN